MKQTALLAILLCLAHNTLHADVPLYINYQGKVADAAGLPIGASGTAASFTAAPVNRKILFRIYSTATGGTPVWAEEQTATVSSGVFSVLLGNGIAATGLASAGSATLAAEQNAHTDLSAVFANSASRFLEIVVDNGDNLFSATDVPVSPRQQITSTAFAFRAKVADGIAPASATSTDLTISPSTLPTGITASNYGLGWYGSGRTFGSIAVDGPVLYGNAGGALGSNTGSEKKVALAWNAAGQVGVGTTPLNNGNSNSTNKLILQGDDATTPAQQLVIRGNTDITERLAIGYDTTLNQSTLQSYTAASYGNLLLNPSGGNIGIGTSTPTNRLTVEYTRQSSASSANAAAKIGGSDVYTYMGSYNNGPYATWIQSMRSVDDLSFPMAINPNGGNVGIGTTAPASKLDVNGSAHVATTLTVDGAASAASFSGNGAALTALAGANLSSGTVPLAALVDAVKQALCPAGSIMAYGGATAPTGWFLCDGTSYTRSTYLALFTAIGTSFGTASATVFNVPDLRGRFLRGMDSGATRDPDSATRALSATGGNTGAAIGSLQADALRSHTHDYSDIFWSEAGGTIPVPNNAGSHSTDNDNAGYDMRRTSYATGGNETRPANINVNYIIKY